LGRNASWPKPGGTGEDESGEFTLLEEELPAVARVEEFAAFEFKLPPLDPQPPPDVVDGIIAVHETENSSRHSFSLESILHSKLKFVD
jgi:hypothetical protein